MNPRKNKTIPIQDYYEELKMFIIRNKKKVIEPYWNDIRQINEIVTKKNITICLATKPVQYINLKAIEYNRESYKVLCLTTVFYNPDGFVRAIKEYDKNIWDKICIFKQVRDVYYFLGRIKHIDDLYVDSDCGASISSLFRALFKKGTNISLYEEGISMYFNGEKKHFSSWHPKLRKIPWVIDMLFNIRKIILNSLGSGTWYGLSKWTNSVYCYFPNHPFLVPKQKKIYKFTKSPIQNFADNAYLFEIDANLPWINTLHHKSILMILTSWDEKVISKKNDVEIYDIIIVKHHPHINKSESKSVFPDNYYDIYGPICCECLASKLLELNNKVTIRTESSSGLMYLKDSNVNIDLLSNDDNEDIKNIVKYADYDKAP